MTAEPLQGLVGKASEQPGLMELPGAPSEDNDEEMVTAEVGTMSPLEDVV